MSILMLAYPLQSALPIVRNVAGSMIGAARPLFGLGMLVTLLMVFKPLLVGVLRAALMLLTPGKSSERRMQRAHLRDTVMLHRMANELGNSQPNLAAELRGFASR